MPLVAIAVNTAGWVRGLPELPAEQRTSAYAYHKRRWVSTRYFHRDGTEWRVVSVTPDRPQGPLSALLANTFYNPRFNIRITWETIGHYDVAALRAALAAAIDKDEDIVTQFEDPDTLKARLTQASTFDALAGMLQLAPERANAV